MLEILILLGEFLYLDMYSSALTFIQCSRFGVVILLINMVLFCKAQRKIVTIQTLFLMLFILFQFGLPIVYAFSPQYYNFYMTLFNETILKNAVIYTVLATQIYIVTATCVIAVQNQTKTKEKVGRLTATILSHSRDVEEAALLLFIITAVVAVPVNLWSAVKAVIAGMAIGNLYRGAMAANGLTRFFQEFFFHRPFCIYAFLIKR